MAQVGVLRSTVKADNVGLVCSPLKKSDAFGTPVAVSVASFGKRHRCARIVVSRVTETSTTTTTTGTNGNAAASADASARMAPGFTSVIAKVVVTRNPRPTRQEKMTNAMDVIADLSGAKVKLQLVSEDVDPSTGTGRRSTETVIRDWVQKATEQGDKIEYTAEFGIKIAEFGRPGAILIRNPHQAEFFLDSISLEWPSGTVHFFCQSNIASSTLDPKPRVFFSNHVYMPHETPAGLKDLRQAEMETLRGNGEGERKFHERIYDYDVYNDLGDCDKDKALNRPILGGGEFLYPRRCRTGRVSTKTDPTKEKKVPIEGPVYVPRDEKFEPIKEGSFSANRLRGIVQVIIPSLRDYFRGDTTKNEFDSFTDIDMLYQEEINTAEDPSWAEAARDYGKDELVTGLRAGEEVNTKATKGLNLALDNLPFFDFVRPKLTNFLRYPLPRILCRDRFAWMRDDEFARQILAGVNPVAIKCVEEFPLRSALDPKQYGPQESAIKPEHIESMLEGLTVAEAVDAKRLFAVDYHDIFMPYVERINELDGRKIYATRALFFLHQDGSLKPVAIELSLPPTAGAPASQRVFTPKVDATSFWLWQLAKVHFCTNDSGYHQLASHWLRTHACTEPYIIATHRQLSVMHPISRLLHPHLRYTMEINAAARQTLIVAGGVIERVFTPGKYSLEMSAVVYDLLWRFDQESLPEDLIRRGMAERDESAPHGLRLRIEDYPYAADGLLIWDSIVQWINDYVSLYYADSKAVLGDVELQAWWNEIINKGHEDKKDEKWWPKLDSPQSLVRILSTMIWIASGHHAAVNFGQYDYSGYVPNQPTLARKLVPEPHDPEFKCLLKHPHKVMLETLPSQEQSTIEMMVVQSLSTHSPDEEYLGYTGNHDNWTSDERAVKAFEAFAARLAKVDEKIIERNHDLENKHRAGAGTVPYELLLQKSEPGITMRGIPNSISI